MPGIVITAKINAITAKITAITAKTHIALIT